MHPLSTVRRQVPSFVVCVFHGPFRRLTDSIDSAQLSDTERREQSGETFHSALRFVLVVRAVPVAGRRIGLTAFVDSVELRLLRSSITVGRVRGVELASITDGSVELLHRGASGYMD